VARWPGDKVVGPLGQEELTGLVPGQLVAHPQQQPEVSDGFYDRSPQLGPGHSFRASQALGSYFHNNDTDDTDKDDNDDTVKMKIMLLIRSLTLRGGE